MTIARRRALQSLLAAPLAAAGLGAPARAADAAPILIGIDAEFALPGSLSAQAIEMGVRTAIDEVNRAGGVLGGRRFDVVTRDHGSIAARGIRNLKEFAQMPGLLAVFSGRFSPVVLDQLPTVRQTQTLLMAPWSSADGVVDNGMQPNYVFRLSLRDALAMPKLLATAAQRKLDRVGLLLTNTGWGRSNDLAARAHAARSGRPRIVAVAWHNYQEDSLMKQYRTLQAAGAQAVVSAANGREAALLVREIAALPAAERLPIISHWGVSGDDFFTVAGDALKLVDFSFIQTFSLFDARPAAWKRFTAAARERYAIERPEQIKAAVGVAHAYDLMHLLALAVRRAGTADRATVRDALEHLPPHDGLIRRYERAFTPTRHEALDERQLLIARWRDDGVPVPERLLPRSSR